MVVVLRNKGLSARSVDYLPAAPRYLRALAAWERDLPHPHQPLLTVPSHIVRTFGDQALRTLLAFSPRTRAEWRRTTLVATLIDTGCRINELLELRWAHVDMDEPTVTVSGKGDKDRLIPSSFELRKRLHLYRKLWPVHCWCSGR